MTDTLIKTTQQIPNQLASYVYTNKYTRAFQVYMYLKCAGNGIINENSVAFQQMPAVLGFKSHNTSNKYLNQALQLNWIGFNPTSGNYFVRGVATLRARYKFHKVQSTLFHVKSLQKMKLFLGSILVTHYVSNQIKHFELESRGQVKTAVETGAAIQVRSSPDSSQEWVPRRWVNDNAVRNAGKKRSPKPDYYGYSNLTLSRILQCSKTTATDMKHQMEALGYIKTIPHTEILATIDKPDFNYRKNLSKAIPELNGRIFFRTVISSSSHTPVVKKSIQVVRQLYDEIIPMIKTCTVQKKSSWFNSRSQ